MAIQQFSELPAFFDSRKRHLGLNIELFHDRSKRSVFRSRANYRQLRAQVHGLDSGNRS
jgi:hypothetical protein